jgi:hypothetical protein
MTKRALVILVALLGCRTSSGTNPSPDPSASAAGSSSTACAAIVAKYDGLVATGGACAADGDCACFNGGVSPKTPCGGVSDHTSAANLDQLRAEYTSAHCSGKINCAAWACAPKCNAGHCENR